MKKVLRVFALTGALALTWFSSMASASFPLCSFLHNTPCSPPLSQIECHGPGGEPGTCICGFSTSRWKCVVLQEIG